MGEQTQLFNQDHGIVKYVVVNGEVRFIGVYGNHDSLVQPGETAESAGFIYYDKDLIDPDKHYQIKEGEWSMTLKLGPNYDRDAELIAKALGIPKVSIKEH